jgi:hypothetical protein
MAFLGKTYEVASLPQGNSNFDPVPAGNYSASITSAELKETSTGGTMIKLRFDITGPSHEGRVVFGNINIDGVPVIYSARTGKHIVGAPGSLAGSSRCLAHRAHYEHSYPRHHASSCLHGGPQQLQLHV